MTLTKINSLPKDRTEQVMQEYPAPVRALATSMRENAVVSSALLMHPNATSLEVFANAGQGVALRWVLATETPTVAPRASVVASGAGANFDHIVPAGQVRRFAIPKETGGVGPRGNVNNQLGSVYGLYQRLAAINAGIGPSSVLFTEY